MVKFKKATINDGCNRSICHIETDAILNDEPFGNCQTYSIAYLCCLLRYLSSKNERIKVLKEIDQKAKKNQLICDISREFESDLEECFPREDLIFKNQYVNNTKNLMTIYMYNTKSLKSNI